MKAHLRSTRIAPKKANLVAGMVRGLPVSEALSSLERTNKKSARIIERLLKSAIANAKQNDNQEAEGLIVKSIVVNKAQVYHRGVPMARGRVRSMRKFLTHITITLGVWQETPRNEKVKKSNSAKLARPASGAVADKEKKTETPSQKAKKPVKTTVKSEKDKSSKEETVTAPASASKSSTSKK